MTPSANGVAASLSDANLQGADFTDAQLYGTNLANAAVAISTPTTANPNQGGVYLFSLPYKGDTHTAQQYMAELNAASTKFSLNPQGDAPTLQKYVTALETNNLGALKIPFLEQHPSHPSLCKRSNPDHHGRQRLADNGRNRELYPVDGY